MTDTIISTWKAYCGATGRADLPDWIADRLRPRHPAWKLDLRGFPARLRILPSLLFAGRAWESILRTLPHLQPGILARREFRYPYLDRDLVEFLLAVPRAQLARPGRRRYMMRNAMKGIVPDLVLERKRKASVERAPIATFHQRRWNLDELFRSSLLVSHGFIECSRVNAAIERICTTSTAEEWPALLRAVNLEIWLRSLSGQVSRGSTSGPADSYKALRLIET